MPTPVPPASPIASMIPATMPTPITSTTITPNTCQPLPRTSSRLRPSALQAAGALQHDHRRDTDQIVIRISPGMMIRMNPIRDPDAGDDPHQDQLADHRRGGLQQLTDGGVAPPVLNVGDQLDDHARVQRGADEDHDKREDREHRERSRPAAR